MKSLEKCINKYYERMASTAL